jgi:hypothetical protein
MSLLIYAGLLYLAGISTILLLKPELMFAKDGSWKEFGLGRNKQKYTWMPFWLFAISWSIISYVIVLVIASNTGLGGVSNNIDIPVQTNSIEPQNVSMKAIKPATEGVTQKSSSNEMKPGYYILNTNETIKHGVPKYIFLGPEAPNLVYQNSITETE